MRGNKHRLVLIDNPEDIGSSKVSLEDVAVVLLTHVSYCTGRMLEMKAITTAIHEGYGSQC